MLNVVYEDADVIVVWKPAGVESQESRGLSADLVSEIRKHLRLQQKQGPAGPAPKPGMGLSTKLSTGKPKPAGEPYVGVIHRLDKPVSGLLVYAKTKTAAARLSAQVSGGHMNKKYLAVLCGKVDNFVDNFADYLLKDSGQNCSRIVDSGVSGGKLAKLSYRVLEEREDAGGGVLTLAEITLQTGRHHQIRVQMSGHGLPLWGDQKYNPAFGGSLSGTEAGHADGSAAVKAAKRGNIALAAYELSFVHPVTGKRMDFRRMPDSGIFRSFAFFNGKPGISSRFAGGIV